MSTTETIASVFSKRGGFTALPTTLLKRQSELGLTNNEVMLVSHILSQQYTIDKTPSPTNSEIGRATGYSVKTVKKWKTSLIKKGFLVTTVKTGRNGVHEASEWDFRPLLRRLCEGKSFLNGDPTVSNRRPYRLPLETLPSPTGDGLYKEVDITTKIKSVHKDCSEQERISKTKNYSNREGEESMTEEELKAQEARIREATQKRLESLSRKAQDAGKASRSKVQQKLAKRASRGLKTNEFGQAVPKEKKSAPEFELASVWMEEFKKAVPEIELPVWGSAERAQIKGLVDKYGHDGVEGMFKFFIRNWPKISKNWFKGEAPFPRLTMIVKLHESVWLEYQSLKAAKVAIAERDAWFEENPGSLLLPEEIADRISKYQTFLDKYGEQN